MTKENARSENAAPPNTMPRNTTPGSTIPGSTRPENVRRPEPLPEATYRRLADIVGPGNVYRDPEDLLLYSYDGLLGIPTVWPQAVVRPGSTEEVVEVLRLAQKEKIPVVPRGAGTGLSGGAMPIQGGLVLSLNRMKAILEIDEDNMQAVVQPGVITAEFHQAVEARGLFYPPDPGSMTISTLGGNVATSAGGLRGLKYGVTRDYVMGLEAVLMGGRRIRTGGRTFKNVTGYDLTRLLVGSEGTLAVITEIILKLIPLPEARRSLQLIYDDVNKAARTVAAILRERVIPATLEIMDRMTIQVVEDFAHVGLPREADAMLLVEVDGAEETVERQLARVLEIARQEGAVDYKIARTEEEKIQVWNARRNSYGALARLSSTIITEDATVPRSKVPDMMRAIGEIAQKYAVTMSTLGHAGDGNLHPTINADKNNPEEMARVEKAVEELFQTALRLGGTLSGEHGISLAKKRFMPLAFSEDTLAVMRAIKAAFDPDNLLNPGKILP